MKQLEDAPDIARTRRDGYPIAPHYPYCPICGEACDRVYKNENGDIVGCDECLTELDAWEVL